MTEMCTTHRRRTEKDDLTPWDSRKRIQGEGRHSTWSLGWGNANQVGETDRGRQGRAFWVED